MIGRFLSTFVLVALAVPAWSETPSSVPGQTDAMYQTAVELWLSGADDLPALQSLSELANDGNTAAQILLAEIASQSHLIAAATADLPRAERIALLRQPGGLSGRSWLEAAAEVSPLAAALRDSAIREERADAIGPLFEFGETAIATRAIFTLVSNGEGQAVAKMLTSGIHMPPEASFFVAQLAQNGMLGAEAYPGSARMPRTGSGLPPTIALAWGPIPTRTLLENPEARAFAINYSKDVPAWRPMVNLCETYCPDEVAECSAVGAAELYAANTFPFASPSQALIPDDVYWSSGRIDDDVLTILLEGSSRERWALYAPISECFASLGLE